MDPRTGLEAHGGAHATLLLVEYNDTLRQMLVGALKSAGYEVLAAKRGEEALQLCILRPAAIHLLLTDSRLTDMTGDDLAARIRVRRPDLRVLQMKSAPDVSVLPSGDETTDAHPVIAKPFALTELADKIKAMLQSG